MKLPGFQFEMPKTRAAIWRLRIGAMLFGAGVGGLFWTGELALQAIVGLFAPQFAPSLWWAATIAIVSGVMYTIGRWLARDLFAQTNHEDAPSI
jgi:hypothetical protein